VRALITGSLGFVGRYLREELEENGYEVIGLDLRTAEGTLCVDLLDAEAVKRAVTETHPDAIFHLAGQADVGLSWREPRRTFELNVIAAINLLEEVREYGPQTRMVLVGSSDEYGSPGEAGKSVSEELELRPQTPYAISKKAQEELARVYTRAYGMNVCMTRSFNHGGAGQREGFLIPDFAAGIVRVEKGLADKLTVGNLTSRRDFTHVKDIVRAYRMLAEKGRPGEVYNVGSGSTWSTQEVLDKLLLLAKVSIPVEQDPAKLRPSDTPVICCDHGKLTRDTGWEPEIPLETILSETIREWRVRLEKDD